MRPTTSLLLDPYQTLAPLGVREGMHVAELGCGGHGHFVFPMAKLVGKNGRVYAVDILEPALRSIQSQARFEDVSHVIPIQTDLEAVGRAEIPAGSLQRAAFLNSLHQMQNRLAALKEARRLLDETAQLLVVDWAEHSTILGPGATRRLSEGVIEDEASQAGFVLKEIFDPGPHHVGLLFTLR